MDQMYLTGSIPLFTSSHTFMTHGFPNVFTYATSFDKCGIKLKAQ